MKLRYAVLNNTTGAAGTVTNVVLGHAPSHAGWIEIPGDSRVTTGWAYDGTEFAFALPAGSDTRTICTVENINLQLAGQAAQPFNGIFFCNPNDQLSTTTEIHQDGVIRSDLSIPFSIKMPLVRHANGQPTDDEIYLNVTLTNGVMTIAGTIPRSGDWKILTSRINEALKVIGADWKLHTPDVTFIA